MLTSPFNQPLLQFLRSLAQRPVSQLVHVQLGVWNLAVRKPPYFEAPKILNGDDIQFWIHTINALWLSLESVLAAYTSEKLYNAVINHLQSSESEVRVICYAIGSQVTLIAAKSVIEKLVVKDEQILADRITYFFLMKSISATLHNEDSENSTNYSALPYFSRPSSFDSKALSAFADLTTMVSSVIKMASQLLFTYRTVSKHPMDPIFIFINVVQPFFSFSNRDFLWSKQYFSYCSNVPFKRMLALHRLAFADYYSTDIKSDGVGDYISKEFGRSRDELGDTCTDELSEQWLNANPLHTLIFNDLVKLSPMLYFAMRLVFYPKSLTPASFAQLQHAASAIHASVYTVSKERNNSARSFLDIHDLYQDESDDLENRKKELKLLPYPHKVENEQKSGMEVEFRDVTFSYPGTIKNALKNVSFIIKSGQLVAIVGVNGSGKSSITNLFNRLYDPTHGDIFIDGFPLRSLRRADVRRSMAILRQSHVLYPLSLRENISLGLPDRTSSEHELDMAIKCGGAFDLIENLPNKLDTELRPIRTAGGSMEVSSEDPETAPLKAILDKEIWKDVSGGEGQRLAASRTFLRLQGGGIRLLVADEPTSALDPEGEFQLFTRLKQQRGDTTVIFVTHRFGHITRNADLILCMKDGRLVEQGTHKELLVKGGEYYKLFNVQTQAFANVDLRGFWEGDGGRESSGLNT